MKNTIYIIERIAISKENTFHTLEIAHISSSFELAQKWIKENCDDYDKNLNEEWQFFCYNQAIDDILEEDEEEFFLFDWNGFLNKDAK